MTLRTGALCAAFLATATPSLASICDYRLSTVLGSAGTAAANFARDTSKPLKDAGVLTLTNVATGATMVGSSGAGASVAGALAGAAPVGIAVGAALLGSEAICYFLDDRITEYDEILMVMTLLAEQSDPEYFELISPQTPLDQEDFILIKDPAQQTVTRYMVRDLYIVNGVLKNRDRWRNTTIGNVGFVPSD